MTNRAVSVVNTKAPKNDAFGLVTKDLAVSSFWSANYARSKLAKPFVGSGKGCKSSIQWNGGWRVTEPPSETVVSVGISGLHDTVNAALAKGCPFVRVSSDTTDSSLSNFTSSTLVYIDPGVTWTFTGTVVIPEGSSFSLRGNGPTSAFVVTQDLAFQGSEGSTFNAYQLSLTTAGTLIDPSVTTRLDACEVFVAATGPCFIGTTSLTPIVDASVTNCVIHSAGFLSENVFLGSTPGTPSQGLFVSNIWFKGVFGVPVYQVVGPNQTFQNVLYTSNISVHIAGGGSVRGITGDTKTSVCTMTVTGGGAPTIISDCQLSSITMTGTALCISDIQCGSAFFGLTDRVENSQFSNFHLTGTALFVNASNCLFSNFTSLTSASIGLSPNVCTLSSFSNFDVASMSIGAGATFNKFTNLRLDRIHTVNNPMGESNILTNVQVSGGEAGMTLDTIGIGANCVFDNWYIDIVRPCLISSPSSQTVISNINRVLDTLEISVNFSVISNVVSGLLVTLSGMEECSVSGVTADSIAVGGSNSSAFSNLVADGTVTIGTSVNSSFTGVTGFSLDVDGVSACKFSGISVSNIVTLFSGTAGNSGNDFSNVTGLTVTTGGLGGTSDTCSFSGIAMTGPILIAGMTNSTFTNIRIKGTGGGNSLTFDATSTNCTLSNSVIGTTPAGGATVIGFAAANNPFVTGCLTESAITGGDVRAGGVNDLLA